MTDVSGQLSVDKQYIPPNLPGGFFIYDAHGDEEIMFADDNVIRIFGCSDIEDFRAFVGNSFRGMVYPEDIEKIEGSISSQVMFGEKRHDYVRYRIRRKDGEIRYIEDFGHLLNGEDGKSYFYVYIVDVEREEFLNRNINSYAEAQILSMNQDNDPLTGLYNMVSFYDKAAVFMDGTGEEDDSDSVISFVYFDILNFKFYNEQFGFGAGDQLLRRIGREIRDAFPEKLAARFANDHFVVCTRANDVKDRLKRLHDKVADSNSEAHIHLNAGIYELEEDCSEVGFACDRARLACDTLKNRYDKHLATYNAAIRQKMVLKQYIVEHIDEAVANGYLKVYYQPVVRVSTREICGYEALVRWIDPTQGFLSPADFIGTLEDYRLINLVDCYVIDQVCHDIRELIDKGEAVVPISINLSRLDFELCDVHEVLERSLEKYNTPRDMVEVEITESALTSDGDFLWKHCKQLHNDGYDVWLDDFGSGYSSLNILTDFEFDVLKMDMMFLRSMDKNEKASRLIRHIVALSHELGMVTLCEGVETEEHFKFLKEIHCDKVQGYYFAKPMPMKESRAFTDEAGIGIEENRDLN